MGMHITASEPPTDRTAASLEPIRSAEPVRTPAESTLIRSLRLHLYRQSLDPSESAGLIANAFQATPEAFKDDTIASFATRAGLPLAVVQRAFDDLRGRSGVELTRNGNPRKLVDIARDVPVAQLDKLASELVANLDSGARNALVGLLLGTVLLSSGNLEALSRLNLKVTPVKGSDGSVALVLENKGGVALKGVGTLVIPLGADVKLTFNGDINTRASGAIALTVGVNFGAGFSASASGRLSNKPDEPDQLRLGLLQALGARDGRIAAELVIGATTSAEVSARIPIGDHLELAPSVKANADETLGKLQINFSF